MPRIKSMIRPGSHWDEVHFSNHVMMDALAKHLLGVAPYRMTDIGEVMEPIVSFQIPAKKDG